MRRLGIPRLISQLPQCSLQACTVQGFVSRWNSSDTPSKRKQRRGQIAKQYQSQEEVINNILYNTAKISDRLERKVLSALVTNEPGVLSRVSGVLAARGFNIDSLTVSATQHKDVSRMTIVLRGGDETMQQAKRQLEDLVPVWLVLDLTHNRIIQRELLLVKVSTLGRHGGLPKKSTQHNVVDTVIQSTDDWSYSYGSEETESEQANQEIVEEETPSLNFMMHYSQVSQSILHIVKLFDGQVVDVGSTDITIQVVSTPPRLSALLKMLQPFGIVEACRSGLLAVPRSAVSSKHPYFDEQQSSATSKSPAGPDPSLLPPG